MDGGGLFLRGRAKGDRRPGQEKAGPIEGVLPRGACAKLRLSQAQGLCRARSRAEMAIEGLHQGAGMSSTGQSVARTAGAPASRKRGSVRDPRPLPSRRRFRSRTAPPGERPGDRDVGCRRPSFAVGEPNAAEKRPGLSGTAWAARWRSMVPISRDHRVLASFSPRPCCRRGSPPSAPPRPRPATSIRISQRQHPRIPGWRGRRTKEERSRSAGLSGHCARRRLASHGFRGPKRPAGPSGIR